MREGFQARNGRAGDDSRNHGFVAVGIQLLVHEDSDRLADRKLTLDVSERSGVGILESAREWEEGVGEMRDLEDDRFGDGIDGEDVS